MSAANVSIHLGPKLNICSYPKSLITNHLCKIDQKSQITKKFGKPIELITKNKYLRQA